MRGAIVAWVQGMLVTARVRYGVNPLVWFIIAVASAPPFYLILAWALRALARGDRSRAFALAGACLFLFLSPWYYVLVAGHDLPWWVYGLMAVFAAWCVVSLVRSLRKRPGAGNRAPGGPDRGDSRN